MDVFGLLLETLLQYTTLSLPALLMSILFGYIIFFTIFYPSEFYRNIGSFERILISALLGFGIIFLIVFPSRWFYWYWYALLNWSPNPILDIMFYFGIPAGIVSFLGYLRIELKEAIHSERGKATWIKILKDSKNLFLNTLFLLIISSFLITLWSMLLYSYQNIAETWWNYSIISIFAFVSILLGFFILNLCILGEEVLKKMILILTPFFSYSISIQNLFKGKIKSAFKPKFAIFFVLLLIVIPCSIWFDANYSIITPRIKDMQKEHIDWLYVTRYDVKDENRFLQRVLCDYYIQTPYFSCITSFNLPNPSNYSQSGNYPAHHFGEEIYYRSRNSSIEILPIKSQGRIVSFDVDFRAFPTHQIAHTHLQYFVQILNPKVTITENNVGINSTTYAKIFIINNFGTMPLEMEGYYLAFVGELSLEEVTILINGEEISNQEKDRNFYIWGRRLDGYLEIDAGKTLNLTIYAPDHGML